MWAVNVVICPEAGRRLCPKSEISCSYISAASEIDLVILIQRCFMRALKNWNSFESWDWQNHYTCLGLVIEYHIFLLFFSQFVLSLAKFKCYLSLISPSYHSFDFFAFCVMEPVVEQSSFFVPAQEKELKDHLWFPFGSLTNKILKYKIRGQRGVLVLKDSEQRIFLEMGRLERLVSVVSKASAQRVFVVLL